VAVAVHKKGDADASPFSRSSELTFSSPPSSFRPSPSSPFEDSSLHWWIAGSSCRQRTLPPGTSARRCGDLASWADPGACSASGEQQLAAMGNWIKKWGARRAPRRFKAEKLPLLRGLFLSALGCLLRHFFLLRLL